MNAIKFNVKSESLFQQFCSDTNADLKALLFQTEFRWLRTANVFLA